jgi:hypothetical protein
VDANMTRRRRTPIENDLQNGNYPEGIIESNSPNNSSGQTKTNANISSETHEIGPMVRQLLDVLAIIALRMAAKRQQQDKQDK